MTMKKKEPARSTPQQMPQMLDALLASMIDEWYDNVSGYYATEESRHSEEEEPELKRFHDEKGHRIKFAKESLQCTYGLRVLSDEGHNHIEISVNNKVENLDYAEFQDRLHRHYAGESPTASKGEPAEGLSAFSEIFRLESDLSQAFSVERSAGKADVVRLSFLVDAQMIAPLIEDSSRLKAGIEEHCLSPMRRIYAELYRRTSRR
jgi:hypothetical protein